jgi:hypothetical protein
MKYVGSGGAPQPPPQPQQQPQFNQFPPHQQRQIQSNNLNNNGQGARGDRAMDNQLHGGKENLLGGHGEQQQQQMLGKGEGELTCKPGDRMMGSRYEHPNLGPGSNNVSNQPPGVSGNSEFNNNYYTSRPCYDQHGGQQQGSGMAAMLHSSQHNNSMENSQESGYHNSQYNHYPGYRAGYGGAAYGMMGPSSSRQQQQQQQQQPGNMMMGNSSSASHGKTSLGSASFQRFPGHSQQQQQQNADSPLICCQKQSI